MNDNSHARSTSVVSYRLARQQVVASVRDGLRNAKEVCDAQPELRRVADECSVSLEEECPICKAGDLVVVSFAFGYGLPKAGRVISDRRELAQLQHRGTSATCYRVEVCRHCWWNHLLESFAVGG